MKWDSFAKYREVKKEGHFGQYFGNKIVRIGFDYVFGPFDPFLLENQTRVSTLEVTSVAFIAQYIEEPKCNNKFNQSPNGLK